MVVWASRCWYSLICSHFLVTRRLCFFGALPLSPLGLCWPDHFLSMLNVFTVCEMRQEICTDVFVGGSIASQNCCKITEASPASPVCNPEMFLLFPVPLLYKWMKMAFLCTLEMVSGYLVTSRASYPTDGQSHFFSCYPLVLSSCYYLQVFGMPCLSHFALGRGTLR